MLGPNGCGKTTLFKCIMGIFQPSGGDVQVYGQSLRSMSRQENAHNIAYIPQVHTPTFNYSVFDVVLMGRACYVGNHMSPRKQDHEIVWQALETMNITHLAQKGYAEISGGERQLVLIARALVQQSKILVMDEPTSNLDYGNQVGVLQEVRNLCDQQGHLIIMSSHNPDHAFSYASKVLIMKDGQVLSYGAPSQVVDSRNLESIYRVKIDLLDLPEKYSTANGTRKTCVPVVDKDNCRI